MKKKGFLILGLLLMAAGVGIYAYPSVSNVINEMRAASEIREYQQYVQEADVAAMDDMIARAEAFNEKLSDTLSIDPFQTGSGEPYEDDLEYNSLLNVGGLMGYIDIPAIDVYLPVFHGTSVAALKKGAGHLYGSSLPVGGEGTHSVVSAHRGLPSARMFTDLDQIQKGDVFYFHVLNRILAYQVDQIEVVEPMELSALDPVPGKEYMTLFTCTPYGINSHRLLVRGVRIPYEVKMAGEAAERISADAPRQRAVVSSTSVLIAIGVVAVVVVLLTAALFIEIHDGAKRRKRKRRK